LLMSLANFFMLSVEEATMADTCWYLRARIITELR
jgi:hypothetical protein